MNTYEIKYIGHHKYMLLIRNAHTWQPNVAATRPSVFRSWLRALSDRITNNQLN